MFLSAGRRYRKFMILSSPRSGTHMLRTSLDAHRNIVCLSEMFNPDYTSGNYAFTEDTPEQEILNRYIFTPQKWRIQAVGFCLHRTHARFGTWPNIWETLAAIPDLRIISLRRRNLLRRYLSFELRPRREVQQASAPLVLDRNQLVTDFEFQAAKVAELDRHFHDHPLLTLAYEDLCTNYEPAMRRVQSFLEVPYRRLEPATPKLISQSLPEAIQNYRQLKQEFAETEWAGFFDD
jgi:Sulfotransferase domain